MIKALRMQLPPWLLLARNVTYTAPTRPFHVKTGCAACTTCTQPLSSPPQNSQCEASFSESGCAASKPVARATNIASPEIHVQFSVAFCDKHPPATMYNAPSGLRAFSCNRVHQVN